MQFGEAWKINQEVFKSRTIKIIASKLAKKLYKLYGTVIKLAVFIKPYGMDLVIKYQVLSVLSDEGGRLQMMDIFKEIVSTKASTGVVFHTKYNTITNVFLGDNVWEFYECYIVTKEDGDYSFDVLDLGDDKIRLLNCNAVSGRNEHIYRSGIVVETVLEESMERAKLLGNDYFARFIDLILSYLPECHWSDENMFGKLVKALKHNTALCILEYHAQKSPHCLTTALRAVGRDRFPYYARLVLTLSPEGFLHTYDEFIVDYVLHAGNKGNGSLSHNELGELFYYMTIGKYYYAYDGCKNTWFEHVEPVDNPIQGQLYKWRQYPAGSSPTSVTNFMVTKASCYISEAISRVEVDGETIKGDKFVKNLFGLGRRIGDIPLQRHIVSKLGEKSAGSDVMEEMNKEASVLGVFNGILDMDLHSADPKPKLCESYSEYFVNKNVNANYIPYDPNRKYVKIWKEIFSNVFIEPDACEYMWYRFSTMLDDVIHVIDYLFITAGGANGKSVVADNLLHVLGNYGSMLSTHLLTDRSRAGSADPELMQTRGIRGGIITETQDNDTLNAARMKTASERVKTGRGLYKDSCNFISTPTITIFSNYQFTVNDVDHGTWRRILAYWPKCRFLDNPDSSNPLEKKINPSYGKLAENCQEAADDLLSILVHYRCELNRKYKGLLSNVESPTIKAETLKYHTEQDVYTEFITKRLLRLSGFNMDINNSHISVVNILSMYEKYGLTELYVMQLDLIDGYRRWMKDVKGLETPHSNTTIINNFKGSIIGKYFSNCFNNEIFAEEVLVGFRIGCDKHDNEYFY